MKSCANTGERAGAARGGPKPGTGGVAGRCWSARLRQLQDAESHPVGGVRDGLPHQREPAHLRTHRRRQDQHRHADHRPPDQAVHRHRQRPRAQGPVQGAHRLHALAFRYALLIFNGYHSNGPIIAIVLFLNDQSSLTLIWLICHRIDIAVFEVFLLTCILTTRKLLG